MICRKNIWCARIDRNCVGSDGFVSVASDHFILLDLAFLQYIMVPIGVLY